MLQADMKRTLEETCQCKSDDDSICNCDDTVQDSDDSFQDVKPLLSSMQRLENDGDVCNCDMKIKLEGLKSEVKEELNANHSIENAAGAIGLSEKIPKKENNCTAEETEILSETENGSCCSSDTEPASCGNGESEDDQNIHKSINTHKCKLCVFATKTLHGLHIHQHKVHVLHKAHVQNQSQHSKKYKCLICGSFHSFLKDLRKHMRTHTKVCPYRCNFCQHRFTQSGNLNRHVNIVHKSSHLSYGSSYGKPYKCTRCSLRFSDRTHLERHSITHIPRQNRKRMFHCDFCSKSYFSHSNLRRHQESAHQRHLKDLDANRRKVCPSCDKIFYDTHLFKSHVKCHDKKKSLLDKRIGRSLERFDDDEWLRCAFCSGQWRNKSLLQAHIDRCIEAFESRKPVTLHCCLCRSTFASSDSRRHRHNHFLQHRWPGGPFQCLVCQKLFSDPAEWKQHINSNA